MLKETLIFLSIIYTVTAFGRRSNITVTGLVGCGRYSFDNAGVELFEKDAC